MRVLYQGEGRMQGKSGKISECVVVERIVAILANLIVDEIDLGLATLHAFLFFVHAYIITDFQPDARV